MLEEGKSPYAIGKELTVMIEKMFEASIPASTRERRARRIRTNVRNDVIEPNHSEKQEKAVSQENVSHGNHSALPEKAANQALRNEKGHFIKPPVSPGRRPKYSPPVVVNDKDKPISKPSKKVPYTNAIYLAEIAISQLSRIEPGDPKREEAFQLDLVVMARLVGRLRRGGKASPTPPPPHSVGLRAGNRVIVRTLPQARPPQSVIFLHVCRIQVGLMPP